MTDPTRPAPGYPAPPQNGYPPHTTYYYPNHNPYYHPPPRAAFFRRFFAALLATFVIFGTILFIIWLILRPRVPSFSLTSLSLSSLNTTSSAFSASFSLSLSSFNPNHKLHLYYDQIETRLFYHSSFLAQNQLPPFDQAVKSESTINAKLVADEAYVDPGMVREFESDRAKNEVEFHVQVLAIVRFKAGGWRARRRLLRVYCDDLKVDLKGSGSNGTLVGGPRRCAVGI